MEDGLVLNEPNATAIKVASLNPCCNGRWSRTWLYLDDLFPEEGGGLNPCCNGRWSRTTKNTVELSLLGRLNPCCNGRWSRTYSESKRYTTNKSVLILVVMEDGLVLWHFAKYQWVLQVLILVVMEDGLVRALALRQVSMGAGVLILVVMEDGLVLAKFQWEQLPFRQS